MGCCTTRGNFSGINKKEQINEFLEESRLSRFTYSEIVRLDTQILEDRIRVDTFEMFLKNWNVKLSFNFLSVQGCVNKFDLKVALLLFSKESFEKKKQLFELIVNSPQKIMRFLEWRFQLMYERIPLELVRLQKVDAEDVHLKIEKARLTAYQEVSFYYSSIMNDPTCLQKLQLLTILL